MPHTEGSRYTYKSKLLKSISCKVTKSPDGIYELSGHVGQMDLMPSEFHCVIQMR